MAYWIAFIGAMVFIPVFFGIICLAANDWDLKPAVKGFVVLLLLEICCLVGYRSILYMMEHPQPQSVQAENQ